MKTDPVHEPAAEEKASSRERTDMSVVTQFFLLPLAVVGGLVGVFLLVTMVTRRPATAEDYLTTLRSGRFNQRWQAAFELSNIIKRTPATQPDPKLEADLLKVFKESMESREEDPRVRRYLVLALGNAGSQEAVPSLIGAAQGSDSETRLYALSGLARLHANESKELFLQGLSDPDPAIRSVCAFGLGSLDASGSITQLTKVLEDPVEEVRWNAALALARLADPSGQDILVRLLDRKYLDTFPHLEPEDKSELILNALRGLKHLNVSGLEGKLKELSDQDPDPAIRGAARTWNQSGSS